MFDLVLDIVLFFLDFSGYMFSLINAGYRYVTD